MGLKKLFLLDATTFFIFAACLIPLKLSYFKNTELGQYGERFQLLPFLREIRKDESVIPVLKTTVLFSFLLAMWLTLQLCLFADVFSSSVEDLTIVRFITSIGLVFGVFFVFSQSKRSYSWMNTAGFLCFAIALLCVGLTKEATILVLMIVSLGFFEAVHMTGNRSHLLKSASHHNSGKMMAMRKVCESIGFITANIIVVLFSEYIESATLLSVSSLIVFSTFAVIHRNTVVEYFQEEKFIRGILQFVTDRLPVKVMKDEHGQPFLYRYHLLALTRNGPGLCIHRFVMSDPDRGFHDHPWSHACSFVLAGNYEERLNPNKSNEKGRIVSAGQLNYVNGKNVFHRVMLENGLDAWTVFAYGKRTKGWGFRNMRNGEMHYKPMASQVKDLDGGWWRTAPRGRTLRSQTS